MFACQTTKRHRRQPTSSSSSSSLSSSQSNLRRFRNEVVERRRGGAFNVRHPRDDGTRVAGRVRGQDLSKRERTRAHGSGQGLRRECLLHIQGLHLHCGLGGKLYTPPPSFTHLGSPLFHLPPPPPRRLVTLSLSLFLPSREGGKGVSLYTTYHGHCRGSYKKIHRRGRAHRDSSFPRHFHFSFCRRPSHRPPLSPASLSLNSVFRREKNENRRFRVIEINWELVDRQRKGERLARLVY